MTDAAANVLTFPSKPKRAVVNPGGWWNRPLPANVRRIVEPRPKAALPPTAMLVSALIEAICTAERDDARCVSRMDVQIHLGRAMERLEDDEEARASAYVASQMLWGFTKGRY